MNAVKFAAILLVVGVVLGLSYGGFGYTTETQQDKLRPTALSMAQRPVVDFPVWAGVGAIAIGAALLLFGSKTR